jgi:AraC family transcriptional regulator
MKAREEQLRREYVGRIERVADYIYAHCGEDFGIDDLADVAAFSRFHFHRVFASVTGETVSDFVKRIRLQRAASLLTSRPADPVTEVAMAAGFSSPSVFARAFKERFGVTASEWRRLGSEERCARAHSTDGQGLGTGGQAESTSGQEAGARAPYSPGILFAEMRRKEMSELKFAVEVKDLPEMTVAYARHIGPYNQIPEAFERLGRWARPRGLYAVPGRTSLAVYHDDPDNTAESKLRSSACVTVAPGTEVSGDINLMTIPGGKYAVARFEIRPDQFGEAWDALMGEWFPSWGWLPDDRMCFEVYIEDPEDNPAGHFVIDICEPVRPL